MHPTSDGELSENRALGTSSSADEPASPGSAPRTTAVRAGGHVAGAQSGSVLQQVRAGLDTVSAAPLDDHPAAFAALHAQLTDALAAVADS